MKSKRQPNPSRKPDSSETQAPSGPLFEDVMNVIEEIEKLYERRGAISGLSTGYLELNRLLGGLLPQQMYIFASRPGVGKSALAANIAMHVAVNLKKPVDVFSLEMSRHQLVQRLTCSLAKVSLQWIRDGFLSEKDFPALTKAAAALAECPMLIDDSAKLSIDDLCIRAR